MRNCFGLTLALAGAFHASTRIHTRISYGVRNGHWPHGFSLLGQK